MRSNYSREERQKYIIDLTEKEKLCNNCGSKMVKVREIVSDRIR